MESEPLQNGDWVRTDAGDIGKVVLISRASAFVELADLGTESTLISYLISRLTKIEPPTQSDGGAADQGE